MRQEGVDPDILPGSDAEKVLPCVFTQPIILSTPLLLISSCSIILSLSLHFRLVRSDLVRGRRKEKKERKCDRR
jgi:hypothetical protein